MDVRVWAVVFIAAVWMRLETRENKQFKKKKGIGIEVMAFLDHKFNHTK